MVQLPSSVSESASQDSISTGTESGAQTHGEDWARLKKRWQSDNRRGLELRHQTGLFLNRTKLGSPTVRQTYGSAIVKDCSKTLKISESELSRMRRFAFCFESLGALKAQHPQVKTWTQVKELLVSLRQPKSDVRNAEPTVIRKETPGMRQRSVRKALSAIQGTTRLMEGLKKLKPEDTDRGAVKAAVDEMLNAIGLLLGVHYQVQVHFEPDTEIKEQLYVPVDPDRVLEPVIPGELRLVLA